MLIPASLSGQPDATVASAAAFADAATAVRDGVLWVDADFLTDWRPECAAVVNRSRGQCPLCHVSLTTLAGGVVRRCYYCRIALCMHCGLPTVGEMINLCEGCAQ